MALTHSHGLEELDASFHTLQGQRSGFSALGPVTLARSVANLRLHLLKGSEVVHGAISVFDWLPDPELEV